MSPSSTLIERLLTRDMTLLAGYTPQTRDAIGPDTNTTSELQREMDDIDMENPMSLYLIISAIQQSQFTEVVPWILDTLLSQGAESDSYCDPEARLFMQAQLPIEMITFVVNSAGSRFALASVIDSLISLDSTDEVYEACQKALAVLGDTDYPSWISFANEADFQGNTMVWLFCQHQARRSAPLAPRPAYMHNITTNAIEKIPVTYPAKNEPEKDRMPIAELAKMRSEDPELFRVWGPSNLQLGASDEDVLDGSADLRMFTDDRFTPEEQATWFTGSCDHCWLRISGPQRAVRKPIEAGGWKGQYCSWDCVRLDCASFEAAAKEMTRFYEKQCSEFGVYDHLFPLRGAILGDRGDPDEHMAPDDRLLTS